jgi:hypothetical protein
MSNTRNTDGSVVEKINARDREKKVSYRKYLIAHFVMSTTQ